MANGAAISNPLVDAFLAAFDARMAILLSSPDKAPMMVDAVSAELLQPLAEQFDVLGYEGYKMANTESQKRGVVKGAIGTHRQKGTPFAIKNAIRSVGYPDASISEYLTLVYNSALVFNGATTFGGSDWAHFSVRVDLGDQAGVSVGIGEDLIGVINEHKNLRSLLVDLFYSASLYEDVVPEEAFAASVTTEIEEEALLSPEFNGAYLFDGVIFWDNTPEVLSVTARVRELFDTVTYSDSDFSGTIYYSNGQTAAL